MFPYNPMVNLHALLWWPSWTFNTHRKWKFYKVAFVYNSVMNLVSEREKDHNQRFSSH